MPNWVRTKYGDKAYRQWNNIVASCKQDGGTDCYKVATGTIERIYNTPKSKSSVKAAKKQDIHKVLDSVSDVCRSLVEIEGTVKLLNEDMRAIQYSPKKDSEDVDISSATESLGLAVSYIIKAIAAAGEARDILTNPVGYYDDYEGY